MCVLHVQGPILWILYKFVLIAAIACVQSLGVLRHICSVISFKPCKQQLHGLSFPFHTKSARILPTLIMVISKLMVFCANWILLPFRQLIFFSLVEIVAAVRLLRVEQGGAFTDLLIEKGRNSATNEMDYVERTLGFRTRDLDDRDIRLVILVFPSSNLFTFYCGCYLLTHWSFW